MKSHKTFLILYNAYKNITTPNRKKSSTAHSCHCNLYADVRFNYSQHFAAFHCKRLERIPAEYAERHHQLCFNISCFYACKRIFGRPFWNEESFYFCFGTFQCRFCILCAFPKSYPFGYFEGNSGSRRKFNDTSRKTCTHKNI